MILYLARRFLASALILIGVTMVTFALAFLMPADPVRQIAGRNATPETVESIRHQLGLDRPVPEQYATYLGHLAEGDLGHSYIQKTDVGQLIMSRLPATLLLMPRGMPMASSKNMAPSISSKVAGSRLMMSWPTSVFWM